MRYVIVREIVYAGVTQRRSRNAQLTADAGCDVATTYGGWRRRYLDFCARRGILEGEMFLLREARRFALILAVVVLLLVLLGAVSQWVR